MDAHDEEAMPEQLEIDNDSFSVDSEELESQFRRLSKRVADFIALQEAAYNKMAEEETLKRRELITVRKDFAEQLTEIRSVLNEFQAMMSSVGIARFRVAAEESLRQGNEHLVLIREQSDVFSRLVDEKAARIDKVTTDAEKRLSRVIRSFRLEYFKRLVEQGCDRVEQASESATQRIFRIVKWFHWEKFGIALMVAIVVAIIMGLFVNDEWPWESHKRVVAEREAGKMLLHAWPHLSKYEQNDIRKASETV